MSQKSPLDGPARVHLRKVCAELGRGVDVAERLDAFRGLRRGARDRLGPPWPGRRQRPFDRPCAIGLRGNAGDADPRRLGL